MLKIISLSILMLFSFNAFAACDIPKEIMSTRNIQKMQELCEKNAIEKFAGDLNTTPSGTSIGKVASELSSSLVIAANNIGVQPETFITSASGIFLALVILWKSFMVQILGLLILLAMYVSSVKLIQIIFTESIEFVKVKRFWGLYESIKKVKTYDNDWSEGKFLTLLGLILVNFVVSWIIIYNMIMV